MHLKRSNQPGSVHKALLGYLATQKPHAGGAYGFAVTANAGDEIPSDGVSFASEKATLNSQGISNAGYVYLQNDKGEAYAVGVHASGRIVLRHWSDGRWN